MSKTITITVFSKQRTANDGKKFKTYFTTMPGDEKAIKVKFREACGAPECPANIDLIQGQCNISKETYSVPVLWVSDYTPSKDVYRDTSMDKYF